MMIYVISHDGTDPFIFMGRDDARAFARARWLEDDVQVEPATLIDHDLALQMTSEELDDR